MEFLKQKNDFGEKTNDFEKKKRFWREKKEESDDAIGRTFGFIKMVSEI